MRLKWSHRRRWRYGKRTLKNVYLSINSGKTFWIVGKVDQKRNLGKRYFWWKNWTVHNATQAIGTWETLAEAQYECQLLLDKS